MTWGKYVNSQRLSQEKIQELADHLCNHCNHVSSNSASISSPHFQSWVTGSSSLYHGTKPWCETIQMGTTWRTWELLKLLDDEQSGEMNWLRHLLHAPQALHAKASRLFRCGCTRPINLDNAPPAMCQGRAHPTVEPWHKAAAIAAHVSTHPTLDSDAPAWNWEWFKPFASCLTSDHGLPLAQTSSFPTLETCFPAAFFRIVPPKILKNRLSSGTSFNILLHSQRPGSTHWLQTAWPEWSRPTPVLYKEDPLGWPLPAKDMLWRPLRPRDWDKSVMKAPANRPRFEGVNSLMVHFSSPKAEVGRFGAIVL